MKSTNLEVLPDLVNNLLINKHQLEEMQKKLGFMNVSFREIVDQDGQPSKEQIADRKKLKLISVEFSRPIICYVVK